MVVLDATIVTIAIPSAQKALHFSTDSRQWIVTAYALAFGSLLLLGGKLGDLFGRKWTLIGGLVGFSIASAIGGLAESFGVLVTARTLQGGFGALLAPSALGLLTVTFEGSPDRPTAFGIFGAIAGGGASLGLILGGALTQILSWRWCLYVNLVIAVPTTIVALRLLVNHRAPQREPIDIPGALTSALGLFALVYGFSNAETHSWGATATIVALIASPVLLTAFVLIERRAKHPLLPLHIIWDRARGGAYITIALAGAGIFAVFLFLTYFLQEQRGLSPLTTGLAFLPLTGVLVVTSTTVQTRVIQHTGVKPVVLVGTTLGAIGMFLFTRLTPSSSYAADVLPGLLVLGVGMGCIFAPAFSTATLGVRGERGRGRLGDGQHLPAGRRLGRHLPAEHDLRERRRQLRDRHLHTPGLADAAAVHGYTTAFWWSVGIFVVGFLLALVILPGRAKHHVPTVKAALARHAIGNCHHLEAADGGEPQAWGYDGRCGAMSTGRLACAASACETLPRSALPIAPRPRWPQTISPASISSAISSIVLAPIRRPRRSARWRCSRARGQSRRPPRRSAARSPPPARRSRPRSARRPRTSRPGPAGSPPASNDQHHRVGGLDQLDRGRQRHLGAVRSVVAEQHRLVHRSASCRSDHAIPRQATRSELGVSRRRSGRDANPDQTGIPTSSRHARVSTSDSPRSTDTTWLSSLASCDPTTLSLARSPTSVPIASRFPLATLLAVPSMASRRDCRSERNCSI